MGIEQEREYIQSAWSEGFTCRQIAEILGVTFQAVHSRLKRMGVDLKKGGAYARRRKEQERMEEFRLRSPALPALKTSLEENLCRWGITAEQYEKIVERYGPYKSGKNPIKAYTQHASNSRNRGIAWEFSSFAEWWAMWEDKYDRRGRKASCLVMARHDDHGPYSPSNVSFITFSENCSIARRGRAKRGG